MQNLTLAKVDQLEIQEKEDIPAMFTAGFKAKKKYIVENNNSEVIYYVVEESKCSALCSRTGGSYTLHVLATSRREDIRVYHPFVWCNERIKIEAPAGVCIGTVQQTLLSGERIFTVKDSAGNKVYVIKGYKSWGNTNKIDFKIVSLLVRNEIGVIWNELSRNNLFGITFPQSADSHMKALLLGTAFEINKVLHAVITPNMYHMQNATEDQAYGSFSEVEPVLLPLAFKAKLQKNVNLKVEVGSRDYGDDEEEEEENEVEYEDELEDDHEIDNNKDVTKDNDNNEEVKNNTDNNEEVEEVNKNYDDSGEVNKVSGS